MEYSSRPLFQSITGRVFEIPRFQRLYSWEEEQCKTLFNNLVDSARSKRRSYSGNVFFENVDNGRYVRIFDGQQRTFTTFIFYLALLAVSREKQDKSFENDITILLNEKIHSKFRILNNDEPLFNEFLDLYVEFLKRSSDQKTSPLGIVKIAKDGKKNRFISNFRYFVVQINGLMDPKINDNPVTLMELYNSLENMEVILVSRESYEIQNGLDANKIFDCLNSTGKKLNVKDIINSRVVGLHNDEVLQVWKDFLSLFSGEETTKGEHPVDVFIRTYLNALGYDDNLTKLEYVEQELIRNSPNGSTKDKEDLVAAYIKLFNKMILVRKFRSICKLPYSLSEIGRVLQECFYEEDHSKLTHKIQKWIKMYLDGVSVTKREDMETVLYVLYREKVIDFNQFIECLHYYWCALTKVHLMRLYFYKLDQTKFNKKNLRFTKFKTYKEQNPREDYVKIFKVRCDEFVPMINNNVVNNDVKTLVEFLVRKAERKRSATNAKPYLHGTQFAGRKNILEYFLYLYLFAGPAKYFGSLYQCYTFYERDKAFLASNNNGALYEHDLGNLVLVESDRDLAKIAKSQKEFFDLLCKNKVPNQMLTENFGYQINEELLLMRSEKLLKELFKLIDPNNIEHLFN